MAGESRECGSYLSKIAAFPLIASAAAAVGSMFLAGPVLRILFGEAYESSAQTLEVLVISVVPFCLVMVASRGLIAAGAQHIDLYANLVGLAAAILVGVFAIPIWGSLGAALAQLACFGSMALVELVYLSRNLAGFRVWKGAAVSSAGILSMYLLLWN
jgi:O-antigen/teichoic acid export membrane protein